MARVSSLPSKLSRRCTLLKPGLCSALPISATRKKGLTKSVIGGQKYVVLRRKFNGVFLGLSDCLDGTLQQSEFGGEYLLYRWHWHMRIYIDFVVRLQGAILVLLQALLKVLVVWRPYSRNEGVPPLTETRPGRQGRQCRVQLSKASIVNATRSRDLFLFV